MYLFDYLHLKIFSFTFYNKFVAIFKLYPAKTAYYVKRQKKFQIFFFICFLWSSYGAGTGTGNFLKQEPETEP
jgi:hypothetical protein